MSKIIGKAVTALTLGATLALTATPADAQWRRSHHRHHNDRTGLAIGAGIIGLGIGAAIASSGRGYGGGYYDRGYYDSGYYGRGYNDGYYRPYRHRRCVTRWEYDRWYGDYVRVRYC